MHHPIIKPNHMQIPWHDPIRDQKELPVSQAPLPIRAGVVGRVGLLLLSCGTGAWRVRSSMNEIAEALGLVCAADIGLLSIEYTCSDGENSFSQTLTLTATGVNTAKLDQLERFVKRFPLDGVYMTADGLHTQLDKIAQTGGSYTPLQLGLAAALACGAFTFLLGGGPIEMLLAFLGAGVGQYVRARLTQRHLTLFGCIALSVAAACLVYAGLFRLASLLFPIEAQHQAGYICAMLFIIPGFPFITSGIDMAKQDMRSGPRKARIRRRRDRRAVEHAAARARQPGWLPAGGGSVFRRAGSGPARVPVQAALGLPAHHDHRTVDRHHGAGAVFLPRRVRSGHDEPERQRVVARRLAADRRRPAAGADLRAHPHGRQLPPVHMKRA